MGVRLPKSLYPHLISPPAPPTPSTPRTAAPTAFHSPLSARQSLPGTARRYGRGRLSGLPPFPAPMKKPPFVVKERFFSRLAVHYFVFLYVSLCTLLQTINNIFSIIKFVNPITILISQYINKFKYFRRINYFGKICRIILFPYWQYI